MLDAALARATAWPLVVQAQAPKATESPQEYLLQVPDCAMNLNISSGEFLAPKAHVKGEVLECTMLGNLGSCVALDFAQICGQPRALHFKRAQCAAARQLETRDAKVTEDSQTQVLQQSELVEQDIEGIVRTSGA